MRARSTRPARIRAQGNDTPALRVESLAVGGAGVARDAGRVVFIDGTVPGDLVRADIAPLRGGAASGRVIELLDPSPARVEPACPYVRECGGCPWMHIADAEQARWKERIFFDAMARIGGVPMPPAACRPLLRAARPLGYRRSVRLHVAGRGVGFMGRGTHDLVDVEHCLVVEPLIDAALTRLRSLLPLGDLRQVAFLGGADAVAASFHFDQKPPTKKIVQRLESLDVAAIVLADDREIARFGDPVLRIGSAGGAVLYGRPDLFAQVNAEQNDALAGIVSRAAVGFDSVLELFGGAGNFTFRVAVTSSQITSVESSSAAVDLGRRSAREAGLGKVRFVMGNAIAMGKSLAAERRFDLVLLDPPRTGAVGIGGIARRAGARRVVYVSCDPATLARDSRELRSAGFRIVEAQPVDMFPQTHHVEAVVTFDAV